MVRFPLVRNAYHMLRDAHPHRLTYAEMMTNLLAVTDSDGPSRGDEELQDGVRWLRSLGLIEDDGRRPLRFQAKKPFLEIPGEC